MKSLIESTSYKAKQITVLQLNATKNAIASGEQTTVANTRVIHSLLKGLTNLSLCLLLLIGGSANIIGNS